MDIRYLHSERRRNHHIDKLYNRSIVDTSIGLSLRKALLHISALVALIFELVQGEYRLTAVSERVSTALTSICVCRLSRAYTVKSALYVCCRLPMRKPVKLPTSV